MRSLEPGTNREREDMTPRRERLPPRGFEFGEEREHLPDTNLCQESPQRVRLEGHSQIMELLSWSEGTLGEIHQNAQPIARVVVGYQVRVRVPSWAKIWVWVWVRVLVPRYGYNEMGMGTSTGTKPC